MYVLMAATLVFATLASPGPVARPDSEDPARRRRRRTAAVTRAGVGNDADPWYYELRGPYADRDLQNPRFNNSSCYQGNRNSTFLKAKKYILDAIECDAFAHVDALVNLKSFLDVGAGSGEITSYLERKYGLRGTAIDVTPPDANFWATGLENEAKSKAALKSGEYFDSRHHRVDVFNGKTLAYDDGAFDLVLFNMVLHHAAANSQSLLKEAARVAKKYVLLAEDVAVPSKPWVMKRHADHDPRGIFRQESEWIALLEASGVCVVATGTIPNYYGYGSPDTKHLRAHRVDFQRFFLAEHVACD